MMDMTAQIDLTAIREPFGLLDAATQDALRKHGGPYERFGYTGWFETTPGWDAERTYRVKPTPPAPKVEALRRYVSIHGAIYCVHLTIINGEVQPTADVVKL
jgi:hypothetical protein